MFKKYLLLSFTVSMLGALSLHARDFCVGDTVMDGHNTYRITAVYADHTADISGTSGNYNVS
ncbi:MAG: hypothetical protein ACXWPM_00975, partial [Bdellovibrionota bacterium]